MADKKITARPGDKITIEINRQAKNPALGTQHSKGLIRSRVPDDFLPRRLNYASLFFYDLGQTIAGTRLFSVPLNFVNLESNGTHTISFPALADFRALEAEILPDAGSVAGLPDSAVQILSRRGAFFDLKIIKDGEFIFNYETDPSKWQNGALRLTSDDLQPGANLSVSFTSAFFYSLSLKNEFASLRDYITNLYDPTAPEVAYDLGKNDRFFLLPTLPLHEINTSVSNPTSQDYLYSDWQLARREPFTVPESEFYEFEFSGASWSSGSPSPDTYALVHKISRFIKETGTNLKAKRTTFNSMTFEYDWTDVLSTDVPRTDYFPNDEPAGDAHSFGAAYSSEFAAGRVLKAVIKQGSQFYFVWRR